MAKKVKTNAMRILDQAKVSYEVLTYDVKDGNIDGVSVANKVSKSLEEVYKTLVLTGPSKDYYVVMVPVDKNISLKAVAKHVGEKKVEMIPVKDIMKVTGYIRGGCSPLGMKKQFKTLIDEAVLNISDVVFSGGKQGIQIEMKAQTLVEILACDVVKVVE